MIPSFVIDFETPIGSFVHAGDTILRHSFWDWMGGSRPIQSKICCEGVLMASIFMTKCPETRFQGQSFCTSCVLGQYKAYNGSNLCSFCEKGTFANETGSIKCHNCTLGRANDFTGITDYNDCIICKPGKYSPTLPQQWLAICCPSLMSGGFQKLKELLANTSFWNFGLGAGL